MARNLLVINVDFKETRVALIEEGVIAELQIERVAHRSTVGNIVLGRVTRVLPGMQAAFIDVGQERAAFLHVEDLIRPNDFDAYLASDAREKVKLKSAEATEDDPSEDESEEGAAPAEVALPADAIEAAGRTTRRGRRRRGRRGRGRDRLSPAGESDVAGPAEGQRRTRASAEKKNSPPAKTRPSISITTTRTSSRISSSVSLETRRTSMTPRN
jgi:Ribonuclease G/E